MATTGTEKNHSDNVHGDDVEKSLKGSQQPTAMAAAVTTSAADDNALDEPETTLAGTRQVREEPSVARMALEEKELGGSNRATGDAAVAAAAAIATAAPKAAEEEEEERGQVARATGGTKQTELIAGQEESAIRGAEERGIAEQPIAELKMELARTTGALGPAEERAREANTARRAASEEAVVVWEAIHRAVDRSAAAATAGVATAEAATTARAELVTAQEVLRATRPKLGKGREAEAAAKTSLTEAKRSAAKERAGMVPRADELNRQATRGRVAAWEGAATGARLKVEVVELRHQLDRTSQVYSGVLVMLIKDVAGMRTAASP